MRTPGREIPLTLAAAVLAAACATTPPPPIPVVGTVTDVSELAGEWWGEYESPLTGRSGTIVFELVAGEQTAHGDVWMTPRGWGRPAPPQTSDPRANPAPSVLTVRFVAVEGGQIRGVIEPYRDPETGFPLVTTFFGRLEDGRIVGSFVTEERETGLRTNGAWRVERVR